MSKYVVAALYRFVDLPDYRELQESLRDFCLAQDVLGTLLLAREGINGTIAGSQAGIDAVIKYLRSDARLQDLRFKMSSTDAPAFYRMKVKLKKEIVTMGVAGVDPGKTVGTYVPPSDWNNLIANPDVMLLDTRNDYEFVVGTFKSAVNPDINTFREFPQYIKENLDPGKHKKVALFCTGGIRCEKATSYLLEQGFEEVYHLQGGILKYLEEVPQQQSLWQGECFVFDNRVTVNHQLEQGKYDQCHGCRRPITEDDKRQAEYVEGVSCPYCFHSRNEAQKAAAAERQKQVLLAEQRDQRHIGPTMNP
jgi:UPF0176 protein